MAPPPTAFRHESTQFYRRQPLSRYRVLVGEFELTPPDPVVAEESVQEDQVWSLALPAIGDPQPVDLERGSRLDPRKAAVALTGQASLSERMDTRVSSCSRLSQLLACTWGTRPKLVTSSGCPSSYDACPTGSPALTAR